VEGGKLPGERVQAVALVGVVHIQPAPTQGRDLEGDALDLLVRASAEFPDRGAQYSTASKRAMPAGEAS
jgi:hypothetical protein